MIHRGPLPDVEIPPSSLAEYVFARSDEWLHAPALIDGHSGRTITYGELRDLSRRIAAGLSARGVQKGDAICIYSPNVPEYAAVFFGAAMIGVTVSPANCLYGAEELARQVRDSGSRYVFTVSALGDRASAAAADVSSDVRIVVLDGAASADATRLSLADFIAPEHVVPAVDIVPQKDVAALPYSSGTTGLPKGVMLTHRNLVANLAQLHNMEGVRPGEYLIGFLPFFHIYGMVVILCRTLSRGGCVVTMQKFDLGAYLELSQRYRVRIAYVVPPVALALARHPSVDQFDLSSVDTVLSGAAPLGGELQLALEQRLGCSVKQGYGMTEASPVTHFAPDDRALVRAGACGPPIPNTECRIVSLETREDVALGEHGELLIRGPQVMAGYLHQPEATAQTVDADGWLHTGDVGYVDAEGNFYVVDRLKEFIKYKGFQIAPAELEALLLTHPSVADAAVIPVSDEEAGEIPKAFVVAKTPIAAEALMEFVATHVAPFKRIRLVEFVQQIPKSASGKILRRELIARERAARAHVAQPVA